MKGIVWHWTFMLLNFTLVVIPACQNSPAKRAEEPTQVVPGKKATFPQASSYDSTQPVKNYPVMNKNNGKLSEALILMLREMPDTAVVECLIFPAKDVGDVKKLLSSLAKKAPLQYNYLSLAGCYAARLQKKTLLELSEEEAVGRVSENPVFKAGE